MSEPAIFLSGDLQTGFEAIGPYPSRDAAWKAHENEQGWIFGLTLPKGTSYLATHTAENVARAAVELGIALRFTYTKPAEAPADPPDVSERLVVIDREESIESWGIRAACQTPEFGWAPRSFRWDRMSEVRLARKPANYGRLDPNA